jgi:hypothetical protein
MKQTDYDHSLTKLFEEAQKKREQGKVLHNSDNNRNNRSPLVVPNQYGSNLNILEVGLDGFHQFYKDTSLDLAVVLAQGPSALEVDPYRKYKQG